IYGKASDYKSTEEIKQNILFILDNYEYFQKNLQDKDFLDEFKWNEIGKLYNEIYKEVSK
ncbi:hypothetical protein, partial [Staphylococcus simulans]